MTIKPHYPLLLLLLMCCGLGPLAAQEVKLLVKEAARLQKAFKDEEALKTYLEVLRVQPDHLTALCRSSELYCITGKRLARTEDQRANFQKALGLARKAVSLYPENAEANFAMSVALGRMALIANGEDKVNAVRDIKKYAERAIALDPADYKGYHVLAKWHYEVSSLTLFERWMVKLAFGGFPESSLDASIRNYEKSRKLNPGLLLNYLEEAKARYKNEEKNQAIELLRAISKLPDQSSDDQAIRDEARKLLARWAG